jgi:hypothetical protein
MQLTDVFLALGQDAFARLMGSVSIGKLKTYQVYERFKTRCHLAKLNTETLQKAVPRLWTRLAERDEEFAADLAQAVLVSRLDMIAAVLDFLGVPHQDGFFAKDMDAKPYFTEGWERRVLERFRGAFPEAALVFYVNHLGWELGVSTEAFVPSPA